MHAMEADCITNIKEETDANSECEHVVSNITIHEGTSFFILVTSVASLISLPFHYRPI